MTDNPLLSKVKLPGRVFQLPSKNFFYQQGVLADHVKNGEIEVKPMSGLAEMKLRSADLLISGKIIREICQECVPEIVAPEKLVVQDVDALFIFLVASTYGDMKTIFTRHDCQDAKEHEYQIDLGKIIGSPRDTVLKNIELNFTVPLSNGQVVNLKPVTFEESLVMANLRQELTRESMKREDQNIPASDVEKVFVNEMMSIIASVEDVSDGRKVKINDRNLIEQWLRLMKKSLQNEIARGAERAADWGFDFKVNLSCRDCLKEFSYELDLNPISFFSG